MKQFKHKTLLARASMMLLAMLCFLGGARAQALFSEDFEDGTMPTGWTTDGSGTWSVGTGDYSSSTGAGQGTYNALIKHGTTGTATKLITPVIDLSSVTSAELSFMHIQRSWAGDYDELRVYYRNSSDGTWTLLAEYTSAVASWTTEDGIVLPNLSSTYQIAFEMTDKYGYGVGVDEVKIVQGASCPKPAGLNVTTNALTATFTWESDASSFVIAHSTNADANPDDVITAVATTNSYNFTDLALGDHYVWVRTVCGTTEQSGWAGPLSFHIGYCVPNPTSHDGSGITGVSFGTGDYVVTNGDGSASLPASAPYYGDYTSMIGAVQAGVESTIAITTNTGSYPYTFVIWVDYNKNLEFEDNEIVYIGKASSGNGTLNATITIPATQATGDYRMRIYGADSYFTAFYNGGNTNWNAVHDPCSSGSYRHAHDYTLRVLEAPSCLNPTNLTSSNVTKNSVELSWTSDANEWDIEVNGEVSKTGITANPYTLTGLTPDTEYTVKVRANCGGGDVSDWSNAVTFTTEVACPAPTSVMASNIAPTSAIISWTGNADATSYNLRYRENTSPNNDFESSSLRKWTTIDADGDGYTWVVASASAGVYHNADADLTGEGHNGSYDFVISGSFSNATGAALNPDNYLVSPQVNLGGSITFWAQAQDASYPEEHFGVAVSTTGNTNASDFTTIAEWTMTAKGTGAKGNPGTTRSGNRVQGTWYEYTVDLSAYSGQGYVAIRHFDCTDQFLLNVDDIEIEQPNFVAPEWTTVEGATSPYTIEGLTPSTDYEVEVQAVNADGTSTWVGTNFTTLEEVPRPSDLAVSEITSRTAKLNWTENGEATAWELCLNNDESNLIAADSKPFTLPNLTPETQYSVKVRAIKGEKKSDWSSSITFTTDIACPAPTELAADNITSTTAEIIWNADPTATGFELQYAERPAVTGTSVLSYDDGTYATAIGSNSGGTWTWGVMYPGSMVTATALNKVSIYESSFNTGDITINVYQGGDDAPGTLLYTETVAPKAADGFHEVILSSPVALTAEQNLWITLTETGTYVMSACSVDDDNNQWVYNNGAWGNIGTLASSLAGYGWMIRAEIGTAASTGLIWSDQVNATSPYEMSGLTPGSTYVVRVKALYDEEGSDWASTIFTTDALAPTDLTVNNILSSSATISWTGYCDTYNVFLGTPINLISVDFEDQTIPTYFTNDENYPWEVVAGNNGYCIQSSNAGVASSTSAISVSKTFTKDGTIEFDAECKGEGTGTAWDQCIFSIDGTAQFTYGAHVNGWKHYSFPVTAGEHTFTWSYTKDSSVNPTGDYFAVDNIVMNESNINWADTPIEVTETECALTGLTPNTTYYVQVVGVIGENNYESGIVSFTTLESVIINFAAEGYATYYNSARDVVLPEGMKAYVVTASDASLTYAQIAEGDTDDNVVPAATAMLLQVEPSRGDQEKIITLTTPTATSYAGTNLLHGSDTETTTTGGTKYYKLTYSSNNDNFGWYWGADNGGAFESPAHKAWLALPASGAPSFLGLPGWEETTGIVPVGVNPEDGEWYTLQGMKVGKKPTTKGVYIHNGRKVLIP